MLTRTERGRWPPCRPKAEGPRGMEPQKIFSALSSPNVGLRAINNNLPDTLVFQGAFASHAAPADTDTLRVRTPPLTPPHSLISQNAAGVRPEPPPGEFRACTMAALIAEGTESAILRKGMHHVFAKQKESSGNGVLAPCKRPWRLAPCQRQHPLRQENF